MSHKKGDIKYNIDFMSIQNITQTQQILTHNYTPGLTYYGKLVQSIENQIFNILTLKSSRYKIEGKAISQSVKNDYCILESTGCLLTDLHSQTQHIIKQIKISLQEVAYNSGNNSYFICAKQLYFAKDFVGDQNHYYDFKGENTSLAFAVDDGISLHDKQKAHSLRLLGRHNDPFLGEIEGQKELYFSQEKEKIQSMINAGKGANEITLF